MNKRGITLIELMVAMTIFVTVMTLAIGGFIAISRSRILIGNMKDSQQKIRVANEMIVRYAKQAQYVELNNNGSLLEMYFDVQTVNRSAKKFEVLSDTEESAKYNLVYSECKVFTEDVCSEWLDPTSILGSQAGGIYLKYNDVFKFTGVRPAVLDIKLVIVNEVVGFQPLSDEMKIENAIILESLK